MGIGGTFGLGAAAWFLASQHEFQWLALILWGVLVYWQLFPVMATAFTENFDSSNFLRFPIRYRAYFFIRMVYGALDPTTLWAGCGSSASPSELASPIPPFPVGRAASRHVRRAQHPARAHDFRLDRTLARAAQNPRNPRHRFPAFHHQRSIHRPADESLRQSSRAALARGDSRSCRESSAGREIHAARSDWRGARRGFRRQSGHRARIVGARCGYAAIFLLLLDIRLRAQFRGENLSESAAPRAAIAAKEKATVREGLALPGFSSPVAAVFEKELRYLSRSGPMLFNLAMPLVILIVFLIGPAGTAGAGDHSGIVLISPRSRFRSASRTRC